MAEQKVDERRRKKQERKKELDTKPKRLSRHRYPSVFCTYIFFLVGGGGVRGMGVGGKLMHH